MSQLACHGCGGLLQGGDRFCDNCGTATADGHSPVLDHFDPSRPFFGHAPRREPGFLSNATRYLCAAAYLDWRFAGEVIWQLIVSRRAVAPSIGIDVGPVIQHCLRSRRIRLIRDVVLVACVLAAVLVSALPVIDFLVLSFVIGVILPRLRWRRRNFFMKLLIAYAYAFTCIAIAIFFLFQLAGTLLIFSANSAAPSLILARAAVYVAVFVGIVAAVGAAQFTYLYSAMKTLTGQLQHGAPAPGHSYGAAPGLSARVAAVEAAQWGNTTLYGGEDPFIGTGLAAGDWSIAIELDRARPLNDTAERKGTKGYVPIDPVELHAVIRDRLRRLNDPGLPAGERIFGLAVDDAVVGSGTLRWHSPLLDIPGKMPCSQASPEAIDALIRHPQAALRYYQRVSVLDHGWPVTAHGRQVIDGVDQGVAVSAFVYVAVEGRMFYLQFVRRALPPIQARYQVIDSLPDASTLRFVAIMIWRTLTSMTETAIYAPASLYRTLRLRWRERQFGRRFAPSGPGQRNFGAQISVREYGAAANFGTYLEVLDIEKYIKITERLLLDTVLDFLADKGVDTSAFAASASSVINGDVINVGPVHGGSNQFGRNNRMQAASIT